MHNKKIISIVVLFAAAASVFLAANFALAADSDLIITEVMYDPEGTDAGNEWIEVYNPGDSNLTIPKNSLGLIDEPETRDSIGKLKNTCHTFDGALDINSREFVVIADNKANFQSTHLDHDGKIYNGKILDSVIDLLNSGDTIKLSFDRCNTWKTDFNFSDSWGANGNKKTLEKSYLLGDNTKENWQESCEDGGTPGEEPKICETETVSAEEGSNTTDPDGDSANSSEKCTTSSEYIKINEIFPYPSSGDEFVEIKNSGADCVDVSGWKVMDEAGHKKTFPENSILEPGKHIYLEGNLYLRACFKSSF